MTNDTALTNQYSSLEVTFSGLFFRNGFIFPNINAFAASNSFPITNSFLISFAQSQSQIDNIQLSPATAQSVSEPFSIIGTLVGGAAAFRIRKKLADAKKV